MAWGRWWMTIWSSVSRARSVCTIRSRSRARILHLHILGLRSWLRSRLCRNWLGLDRRRRRRWRRHHSAWRTILNDGAVHRLLGRKVCRTRVRVLDSIHRSFKDVRLDSDRACSQLRHRLFRGIVGRLFCIALSLHRLRPVLLEYALAQPFLS
jgi:hypothetical protein